MRISIHRKPFANPCIKFGKKDNSETAYAVHGKNEQFAT